MSQRCKRPSSAPATRRPVTAMVTVVTVALAACSDGPNDPSGGNVGPEGGRLEFFGGRVVLDVPEGALAERIAITVTTASDVPADPLLVANTAYDFGPDGTQFTMPVTLTLRYGAEDIPAGVRGEELRVFTTANAAWQQVPASTADPTNGVVQATITGFSVYGVLGVPVASVVVSPDQWTLTVGSTVQLEATANDASGSPLPDRAVMWTSGTPSVAVVSEAGLVTALAEGVTVVTAESEGETASATIAVTSVPIASIDVTPPAPVVTVGGTVQMTASPRDADGNVLTGRDIVWSSDDVAVASISATGLVTGEMTGSATVTATSEGVSGIATVTVSAIPVATIEITPASVDLLEGEAVQLEAVTRDADGNVLPNRPVIWTTDDHTVADVDGSGLVTAVSPGNATITATSEGQSSTAAVTVAPAPVASIEVLPPEVTVSVGSTTQLTAVVRDAGGNVLSGRSVTWTSGDVAVAIVSDVGEVTGVAAGETTVTARSEGQAGSAVVTVVGGTPTLSVVAEGLDQPVFVTAPPGDATRIFVVEQPGVIRIIENGTLLQTPFLDIRGIVRCCGERGLLSMAFHPQFAQNGYFFVHHSDGAGDTRIARYSVTTDPNVADPASATEILSETQPASNHNGGLVAFGPDGFLYVGLGDGGGAGDPAGNGQNRATLLGTILRIDVDGTAPYEVPVDNPFVGDEAARPEIWAYGLRNPWRFSFDRGTDDLYIADVGQNNWEEVDVQPASSGGGENYGWNIMEGAHCFGATTCDQTGLVLPVHEYSHSQGCSITGGYVYRGTALPSLAGTYFYADLCEGIVRSFRYVGGNATDHRAWTEFGTIGQVASFGEDADGELYVATLDGRIYRLEASGG